MHNVMQVIEITQKFSIFDSPSYHSLLPSFLPSPSPIDGDKAMLLSTDTLHFLLLSSIISSPFVSCSLLLASICKSLTSLRIMGGTILCKAELHVGSEQGAGSRKNALHLWWQSRRISGEHRTLPDVLKTCTSCYVIIEYNVRMSRGSMRWEGMEWGVQIASVWE